MPSPLTSSSPETTRASLATALHIGASSVSMMVGEPIQDGNFHTVDFLEQPAPLARDIFRSGHVAADTTERIVTIIKGFQQSLAELGLDPLVLTRAAATNILSEARNHESFTNRIQIATGLKIDPIDDGEMTRLIYLKTRRRLAQLPMMSQGNTLVVHVGPGNTRALLFSNGRIIRYTSYRLGTHRTREAIEASHAEGASLLRVVRQHAQSNLDQIRLDYADTKLNHLVAIGYEIQAIVPTLIPNNTACTVKRLKSFTEDLSEQRDIELVKRFQLDYQTAEALLPALEINLAIAEEVGVSELRIPNSEYEQGLLHDLLVSREHSVTFAEEVIRSAGILAERYQSDPRHGNHVASLCSILFTGLRDLHQLGEADALLLHVAAILHEVGTYVSPRAHHKHSEYLILNSEVFGLDRLDVTLVALIARYHRHAMPSTDHPGYAALDPEDRIRVCKLAALLRVADALERTHAQRINRIELLREPGRLRIRLPGANDTTVERLAMSSKADLFERTFGLHVVVEEIF
jgi:exopolyphosphatase/guanosine-5'-triphosphate,3'-diphosphate pyrophosphatase